MIMLIHLLGTDYVVWDKAASIRFRKPGRHTLFARFRIDDTELQHIQQELQQVEKIDRIYLVDLVDEQDTVHATIEKTIHVRRK